MTDANINKMVSISDYSSKQGIYAIFSDYDRNSKKGILRYIGDGLDDIVVEIVNKYKRLCVINTTKIDDSEEYDLDE